MCLSPRTCVMLPVKVRMAAPFGLTLETSVFQTRACLHVSGQSMSIRVNCFNPLIMKSVPGATFPSPNAIKCALWVFQVLIILYELGSHGTEGLSPPPLRWSLSPGRR